MLASLVRNRIHPMNTRALAPLWLLVGITLVAPALATSDPGASKKAAPRLAKQQRTGNVDCAAARALECGAVLDSTTIGLVNGTSNYGCADYDETGGEVVVRFTLAAPAQVTIHLSGLASDLDLFLLAGCDASGCIAASTGVSDETIVRCLEAGTYHLVVDGYHGAASAFRLQLDCGPCGPCGPDALADLCSMAALIPGNRSPYVISGNTRCAHDDYHDSGCTGYSSLGRDLAYRIVMPPGCIMQAFLRDGPDGVTLDRSLFLVESCDDPAGTCVAGSDAGIEVEESITYQSAAGGIYYLIVDAFGLDASGDFVLEVRQTNCSVVGIESRTWQEVKRLYR